MGILPPKLMITKTIDEDKSKRLRVLEVHWFSQGNICQVMHVREMGSQLRISPKTYSITPVKFYLIQI